MSSLCFPWLRNKDKILSNKVCRIFLFSLAKINGCKTKVPWVMRRWMHVFCLQVQVQTGFSRPFAFVVVALRSCACLWKCRFWGSVFFKEIHLHVSLLNSGGGGCQGKLSYCQPNRREMFSLGLVWLHINTDITLVLRGPHTRGENIIKISLCLIAQFRCLKLFLWHMLALVTISFLNWFFFRNIRIYIYGSISIIKLAFGICVCSNNPLMYVSWSQRPLSVASQCSLSSVFSRKC